MTYKTIKITPGKENGTFVIVYTAEQPQGWIVTGRHKLIFYVSGYYIFMSLHGEPLAVLDDLPALVSFLRNRYKIEPDVSALY